MTSQYFLNQLPAKIKNFVENYKVIYGQESKTQNGDKIIGVTFRIKSVNFLMTVNEPNNLLIFCEGLKVKSKNEQHEFANNMKELGFTFENLGVDYDKGTILHEITIALDEFNEENLKTAAELWSKHNQ